MRKSNYLLSAIFLVVFLFFLYSSTSTLSPPGETEKDLIQAKFLKWQQALVWVNYQSKTRGTGFFVSRDGLIATTKHLFDDWIIYAGAYRVYVATKERDKAYLAQYINYSIRGDIMLLKINYKPSFWFDKFKAPQEGQRAYCLGFPRGWRNIHEGRIILHHQNETLGFNFPPSPGSSGSVIVDKDGYVLGYLVGANDRFSVIRPSLYIQNCLKKYEMVKELKRLQKK